MKKSAGIFIFTSRASFMQRVADLVRPGHHLYLQGTVPIDRAATLYEKFDRMYDISLDKLQASRLRKTGRASARLLFSYAPGATELQWLLLRTEGELSPVAKESKEKWRDALPDRIQFDRFECVRITKLGQAKPSYSWRYSKEQQELIRVQIVHLIRSKLDHELEKLIKGIWKSPGFAGIREQIKKMRELIQSEWKRSRKSGSPMPEIPEHLGYVRRIKDKGVMLSALIKSSSQKPLAPENSSV